MEEDHLFLDPGVFDVPLPHCQGIEAAQRLSKTADKAFEPQGARYRNDLIGLASSGALGTIGWV